MIDHPSIPLSVNTVTFMIRIKDDHVSETYARYSERLWRELGFSVSMYDAVTPATLAQQKGLTFDYMKSAKYTSLNIKKEFTLTEQAIWYSHYNLWHKCVEMGEPIFILEQDTVPSRPENLVLPLFKDKPYDIIFFDKYTMGCYYITPRAAAALCDLCSARPIDLGPYGTIEEVIRRAYGRTNDVTIVSHALGPFTKTWEQWYAAEQVLDPALGTSIDHYGNTAAEPFIKKFKSRPNFFKLVSLT